MSGGHHRTERSSDPTVRLISNFLTEQYGPDIELPIAQWEADAKEIIRLVTEGRCRHLVEEAKVTNGVLTFTCAHCHRLVDRMPYVEAG